MTTINPMMMNSTTTASSAANPNRPNTIRCPPLLLGAVCQYAFPAAPTGFFLQLLRCFLHILCHYNLTRFLLRMVTTPFKSMMKMNRIMPVANSDA